MSVYWYEIPVTDIDRAVRFYQALFNRDDFERSEYNSGFPMAVMGDLGGGLVQGEGFTPSANGVRIYIDVTGQFDEIYARIEQVGGTIVMPRTGETRHGEFAGFIDSEGNRINIARRLIGD